MTIRVTVTGEAVPLRSRHGLVLVDVDFWRCPDCGSEEIVAGVALEASIVAPQHRRARREVPRPVGMPCSACLARELAADPDENRWDGWDGHE